MSTQEHEGDATKTWGDFRAKFQKGTKPKARTASGRSDYESDGIVPDGRSRRATGRTVKITLKVKPEFKAQLAAMAASRGKGMAEILEAALAKLEAA